MVGHSLEPHTETAHSILCAAPATGALGADLASDWLGTGLGLRSRSGQWQGLVLESTSALVCSGPAGVAKAGVSCTSAGWCHCAWSATLNQEVSGASASGYNFQNPCSACLEITCTTNRSWRIAATSANTRLLVERE